MLRLELIGISKQYPAVKANDGVNLRVKPGEIHAVLGENGAGKSTMMKMIYGAVRPDEGEIRWNGQKVEITSPERRHPFYQWIADQLGEAQLPRWNFHKYLIGKDGAIAGAFGSKTAPLAPDMLEEIKGAPLLRGYRGQPTPDAEALAEVLARVSNLIADHADRIAEIDVNPLFVRATGQGAVAADALIVLK